jgi:hypothetical protein
MRDYMRKRRAKPSRGEGTLDGTMRQGEWLTRPTVSSDALPQCIYIVAVFAIGRRATTTTITS